MTEKYRRLFGGFYVEVPPDTPLSYQKCCGETGWGNLYKFPEGEAPEPPVEAGD